MEAASLQAMARRARYLSLIPFYGVDLVSLLNHQPPAFIAEADAVVAFKLNPPTLHGATSP